MTNRCIAVFSLPEPSHLAKLLPLVSGLAAAGHAVHVFSHRGFSTQIEAAGARCIDLYSRYPLEAVDFNSVPKACRYVTYAAHYADAVCEDMRRLRPDVIIYDTFAVIGYVVARCLSIPYVNVCAGHNANPSETIRNVQKDLRVDIHPECWKAAERLREQYGIGDASPFSYISSLSPFLNVYCEPPAFLTAAERQTFEPIAFFGSLARDETVPARASNPSDQIGSDSTGKLRVYVSFGTVIWRYYAAEALAALQTIAKTFAGMQHVSALITLGGHDLPRAKIVALERPNVRVERYVDQWAILRNTDLFITHQGLNSTHEAIFQRVPMISYPFFWDQPGLARRCQELGLSIPLVQALRAPVDRAAVVAALEMVASRRDAMIERLQTAWEWEQEVMANRGAVLQRIANLEST